MCGRTSFFSLLGFVYKYTNHAIICIFLRIFPLLFFLHALFRLPEKNMNKNKSLLKRAFSPRLGRLSRGARLFMLLLLTTGPRRSRRRCCFSEAIFVLRAMLCLCRLCWHWVLAAAVCVEARRAYCVLGIRKCCRVVGRDFLSRSASRSLTLSRAPSFSLSLNRRRRRRSFTRALCVCFTLTHSGYAATVSRVRDK